MTERTTILVPVRYPLTDESTRTLAEAGRIAEERAPADVTVLHVNLFHADRGVQMRELTHAVGDVLGDVEATVITRRGFFVEEVIHEEAEALGADVVVVGGSRTARWRRLLRRLTGNDPAVGSYLRTKTNGEVEVVEVDRKTGAPMVGS